jgi:hypothetical protein
MGCSSAFTITLSTPIGGPGAYKITGAMDDIAIRCAYDSSGVYPGTIRDCDKLFIGFDGSGSLEAIESPRVSRLSLAISRDGDVIASKTFAPKYSFKELNGPGCGTCAFAHDSL